MICTLRTLLYYITTLCTTHCMDCLTTLQHGMQTQMTRYLERQEEYIISSRPSAICLRRKQNPPCHKRRSHPRVLLRILLLHPNDRLMVLWVKIRYINIHKPWYNTHRRRLCLMRTPRMLIIIDEKRFTLCYGRARRGTRFRFRDNYDWWMVVVVVIRDLL